jgi:hypothetical protein
MTNYLLKLTSLFFISLAPFANFNYFIDHLTHETHIVFLFTICLIKHKFDLTLNQKWITHQSSIIIA